jgi:hypothetical protein
VRRHGRAGSTTALSADGYRAGESVEFCLGSTSLGRVLADNGGTVSFTAPIPAGAPSGKASLTAVGAGSGYTTATEVKGQAAR